MMHEKCEVLVVRPQPRAFDSVVEQIVNKHLGGDGEVTGQVTIATPCNAGAYTAADDQMAVQHLIRSHLPKLVILIAFETGDDSPISQALLANVCLLRTYDPSANGSLTAVPDGYSFEVLGFVLTLSDEEDLEFDWKQVEPKEKESNE